MLERLGITPLAAEQFHLADGTAITRKKGIALFRYGDRVGGADAIFGEDEDSAPRRDDARGPRSLSRPDTAPAASSAADPRRRLSRSRVRAHPNPKCRTAFPPRYFPTIASGTPYLDSVARASSTVPVSWFG